MTGTGERTRLDLMREMMTLTSEMVRGRGDLDLLTDGVAKRQALIDAFDALPPCDSNEEREEIKRLAASMLQKDKALNAVLLRERDEAKQGLSQNQAQQKLMGYAGQAVSSAGNYMDFKK